MEAIVEAVTGAEPELPVAIIEQVAAQVAPARMQLRRLAQALTTDPELLTSGRGEGPRHVELLIRGLLPHGTRRLVLPRCAGCGRTTSLEHRDGARRLCSHCKRKTTGGEPREPCAVCGKSLKVFCHDQDGFPRCQKHPPAEDGTDAILRILKQLDTGLDERTATAAIKKSLPHAHQRRKAASQLRHTCSPARVPKDPRQ
ncbi:hypothetical protein [Streptomyces cinnamoneus]|uniref:hypothetical protein n=1 Tax=Streptomyces cinnamoneus TaxID=53446 RepID=UPI0037B73F14